MLRLRCNSGLRSIRGPAARRVCSAGYPIKGPAADLAAFTNRQQLAASMCKDSSQHSGAWRCSHVLSGQGCDDAVHAAQRLLLCAVAALPPAVGRVIASCRCHGAQGVQPQHSELARSSSGNKEVASRV